MSNRMPAEEFRQMATVLPDGTVDLDDILLKLRSHVGVTPGAIPHRSHAVLVDCETAFQEEYVLREDRSISPKMLIKLMGWLAPVEFSTAVGALTQSSGWGKSRLFAEVGKTYRSFYISMSQSSNTFPRQTGSFTPLQKILRAYVDADLIVSHIMKCLASYIRSTLDDEHLRSMTPTEWFHYQLMNWHPTYDMADGTTLPPLALVDATADLKLQIKRFTQQFKVPYVLFMCDEAAALLTPSQTDPFCPVFRLFRRAFAVPGITACFASTNSRVQNFAPALHDDDSYKRYLSMVRTDSSIPIAPVLSVGVPDCGVQDAPYPVAMHDLLSVEFLSRFGRPLWFAFSRHFDESYKQQGHKALTAIATSKLIGKSDPGLGVPAAVMVVACVRITPSIQLAEQLVCSHMATLLHVSKNRELLYVAYGSEPYLAEAAIQHITLNLTAVLHQFLKLVGSQAIDKGRMGEVIARLCLALHGYESLPTSSMLPSLMTVEDLLRKCVGSEEVPYRSDDLINFTHFIGLEGQPTKDRLCAAFVRRAALFPIRSNQPGYDLVIPALKASHANVVEPDQMTAIFIQVKNRREGLAEGPLLEAMVEQVRLEPSTVSADGCHFWLLQRARQRTRRPLSVNCASFTFGSLFHRFQQSVVALLTSLLNDTVHLMTSVDHGRKPEEQLRVEKTFYEMITKLPDYVPARPLDPSGHDCESGEAKRARMINESVTPNPPHA